MAHLDHLIAMLRPHIPDGEVERRDGASALDPADSTAPEQRLRAISALLISLASYQRRRAEPGSREGPAPDDRREVARSDRALTESMAPQTALAAAAARYIARDLAARRLSEFTSAEGYRLARALARIGGVDEPVDELLTEASEIRLHPPPLSDAVSRSPG